MANDIHAHTDLKDLIARFREQKDAVIESVYRLFRNEFLTFAKSITTDKEVILDCFQEAVIALYENLVNEKLKPDNVLVKTYLFAIGKNKLFESFRKKSKTQSVGYYTVSLEDDSKNALDEEVLDSLSQAFDHLGDQCKKILIRFYYRKYSIEAIMHDMEYKNENTVKAHKSRCLAKLREIFKNK